ncbi:predicted protein [Paecilomyces variotii No. 5]|uniref:RNase H type-1 domain-containing protein n=1 Tax=Byssochlamys spectabilis (strain No. 5 / NBRC 109023) TaxID=1356009 RepID=V5FVJ9_BYSSN|nr:predicted protein [Paecilomyces variotii No. 5]
MGALLSVLSSYITASTGTGATAVSKRPNAKGPSFPEASVSSSRRALRKRQTLPPRNMKLNRKTIRVLTSQEIVLLEEACALDEIQIIRQQILKQGIQLEDMILVDDYCSFKGRKEQQQSVTMSLSDEYGFPHFKGSVVIQKTHIQALSYALSEYKLRSRIPNRMVYWVNGSVARRPGRNHVPGIAVVSKSKDEGCPFLWKIQGYRIHKKMGCLDIELLAILQALQIAFDESDETRSEGIYGEQQTLVIYSGCQEALDMILHHLTRARRDTTNMLLEWIVDLTDALRDFYGSVELHWVPGHRDVPGNYLAEYVARRAWDKSFRFELTTSEEGLCRDYKMRKK